MRLKKDVSLTLHYYKSRVDKENGTFIGGVVEPKYQNELLFNIENDYDFDIDTETFIPNGLYAIEISGTNRALKELGKFLINMAMFNTTDEDYHEHIDQICSSDGKPIANITIRKNMSK